MVKAVADEREEFGGKPFSSSTVGGEREKWNDTYHMVVGWEKEE